MVKCHGIIESLEHNSWIGFGFEIFQIEILVIS